MAPYHTGLDAEGGRSRQASVLGISRRHTDELSVHRAALTSVEEVLHEYPGVSLSAITARDARDEGVEVIAAPTPDDASHALIRPARSKGIAKGLARKSVWVYRADD